MRKNTIILVLVLSPYAVSKPDFRSCDHSSLAAVAVNIATDLAGVTCEQIPDTYPPSDQDSSLVLGCGNLEVFVNCVQRTNGRKYINTIGFKSRKSNIKALPKNQQQVLLKKLVPEVLKEYGVTCHPDERLDGVDEEKTWLACSKGSGATKEYWGIRHTNPDLPNPKNKPFHIHISDR